MRYSIHRSLGELKTLDKKIRKKIGNTKFIGLKKESANKEYNTGLTVEEFELDVKSSFESTRALIERRKKFKEAIVNSNAVTYVTIAGTEMTVASAIERKDSIQYEKDLLIQLSSQYGVVTSSVTRHNDSVEQSIDEKINVLLAGDATKNKDMAEAFGENYRKSNNWSVIDPLGLKAVIEKLEKDITDFENEVDVILSESNATTFIDIED